MALPRTPFAPDPGYENTCTFYPRGELTDPVPRGRVRPEAEDVAKLHAVGTVGLLLCPQEVQAHSRYRRPEPRNHARDNLRRIREIQAKSKRRREEEEEGGGRGGLGKPMKPLPPPPRSSEKYEHVQARVTRYMQHTPAPDVSTSLSLPLHPASHRVPPNGTPAPTDQARPQSAEKKNFLAANKVNASRQKVKRSPSQQIQEELKVKQDREQLEYKRGMVPQYLRKRQEQWKKKEEERLASLPDPSIPPGHTLMPREDRIKTLAVLQEHQETLMKEMQSLPIRSDTLRARNRRTEIENKLAEIDDAIKIFSRPKVFIRMDD